MEPGTNKFRDTVDSIFDTHLNSAPFSAILLTADTSSQSGGVHASILNAIDAGILFTQLRLARERLLEEYPHLFEVGDRELEL